MSEKQGPPEHPYGQDDELPDETLIELAEQRADTAEKRDALEKAKARRGRQQR